METGAAAVGALALVGISGGLFCALVAIALRRAEEPKDQPARRGDYFRPRRAGGGSRGPGEPGPKPGSAAWRRSLGGLAGVLGSPAIDRSTRGGDMGFSVKAWRVARGMTQTELAEALGITSRSVISLEQGPETPLATRLALQAIEDGWRDHGERAGE